MRFRLRTLLILLAVLPPILGAMLLPIRDWTGLILVVPGFVLAVCLILSIIRRADSSP
jgi:hypothetical protein